jgi:hypothetical protein
MAKEMGISKASVSRIWRAHGLKPHRVDSFIRADVHPMEETNGFRALLNMEEPKYSIEKISARTGQTSSEIPPVCTGSRKPAALEARCSCPVRR